MNKKMLWIMCAIPLASVHARWEATAAVGAGFTDTPATVRKDDTGLHNSWIYKFNYKDSGITGGLSVGWLQECAPYYYGINLGYYRDGYEAKNNSSKKDLNPTRQDHLTTESLKRDYTIELSAKFGTEFAKTWEAYGKVGALYSKFNQKGASVPFDPDTNGQTNKPAWGTVLGVGIQKKLSHDFRIGLEYDFHYYQKIKRNMQWGHELFLNYRIHPRYHSVYFTITKLF